ncbi:MAG TPA: helix-hairpin-helix domain-containing protein [Stackebrandtia sp.]|uniref:helix-hairpin-helix domain-containing protein n=1 Tax=Stackebrandtia sp. TaxID=2023065 RepID=UPI002D31E21B|nr:helix-hairpin-helix domain-containing protein [Stackebrandtia sp.]HZE40311.1 helix-hairpin-helix domain-containing protein [Stackebrandtia sp.]
MSISTQVPATRGVSTGKHRTSKQAEFAAAVRDRLGRLTKPPADDSPPDSCDEVVDTRTGEPCEDTVPDGRADGAVAGWLGLRGARIRFDRRTRGVLAMLMLVVAVAAATAAWFSWPSPQQAPQAMPVAATHDGGEHGARPVLVSVVGDVVHPGMVKVRSGARVADAIQAAGGLRPEAKSAGFLNLARKVNDGEMIVVNGSDKPAAPADPSQAPKPSGDGTSADPSAGGQPAAPGQPVNLNDATEEQLDTLPGVGPVTARNIIAYREKNGGFDSVDQLTDVDGIGPATLKKLSSMVTV